MWTVTIHRLVVQKDFKKISPSDRSFILKTIYKKLGTAPEKYGAPLRHSLKGYWKLRVSHFRVIYRIQKEEVLVLVMKIGMRRDDAVYREMIRRLRAIETK